MNTSPEVHLFQSAEMADKVKIALCGKVNPTTFLFSNIDGLKSKAVRDLVTCSGCRQELPDIFAED